MKKAKRHVRRQMCRIYYGPEGHEPDMYWKMPCSDAKNTVTIHGNVEAALRAHRGSTVACAISNGCMDDADAFPHPAKMVSVTKSTVYVVDRVAKDGSPAHAVRYGHCYGCLVDYNDTGKLKQMVVEFPELMARPFTLTPPRKRPTGPHGNHKRTASSSPRSILHLRGALARAVTAGRISQAVAEQLAHPKRNKPAPAP